MRIRAFVDHLLSVCTLLVPVHAHPVILRLLIGHTMHSFRAHSLLPSPTRLHSHRFMMGHSRDVSPRGAHPHTHCPTTPMTMLYSAGNAQSKPHRNSTHSHSMTCSQSQICTFSSLVPCPKCTLCPLHFAGGNNSKGQV